MSLADVIVLPYRRIYQSGVMLQAMSYGIPVIASDLKANREMLNGENGLLFKEGDSADLASKINLLISDDQKRGLTGKNAIDYVAKKHNWKDSADMFMNVLNSIK